MRLCHGLASALRSVVVHPGDGAPGGHRCGAACGVACDIDSGHACMGGARGWGTRPEIREAGGPGWANGGGRSLLGGGTLGVIGGHKSTDT